MPVNWELVSPRRAPALCATARLGGVMSRDDVGSIKATVASALSQERSLVIDIADLRLRSSTVVEVFAQALAAAGGWPTARTNRTVRMPAAAGRTLPRSMDSAGVHELPGAA